MVQMFSIFRPINSSSYKMFYSCFNESIRTSSFICWHGSLSIKQKNRVNDVVKVCRLNCFDLSEVHQVRCVRKAKAIIADPSLPSRQELALLPPGR